MNFLGLGVFCLILKERRKAEWAISVFLGEHADNFNGEVTLIIEFNRKLRGENMTYGQNLEVIQPLSLRIQILDIIKQQMEVYSIK